VLILVHGATLNGHMWDPVRRHLDPQFQLLAPDLPGHGTRRSEAFTMEGAVATVVAAARSVAPAPVVLVGDSLGGYTSMASAAALPQAQLKGLVLGGCSANVIGFSARLPFVLKSALFKLLLSVFDENKLAARNKDKVREMLAKAQAAKEDVEALIAAGLALRAFPQAVASLTGVDYRSKFAAISQPTLLVNGALDHGMVKQEASFMAVGQRASSHRFDNCEHGVSLLRSAEFAALVKRFALECCPPRSASWA
jgi:pimeloyl-ACP methyl ester carboxylesterase